MRKLFKAVEDGERFVDGPGNLSPVYRKSDLLVDTITRCRRCAKRPNAVVVKGLGCDPEDCIAHFCDDESVWTLD